MSKFIYVKCRPSNLETNVLINVDMIQSIELIEEQVLIRVLGVETVYSVDEKIEQVISLIQATNSQIITTEEHNEISELFARLKLKYATIRDISKILKVTYPKFYKSDHINAIDQRLKRLQQNPDNLDSYPQKREVFEQLKVIDSWQEILEQEIDFDDLLMDHNSSITIRTVNCLQNANIIYYWQLVQYTEIELLRLKNLGRRSLKEIKQLLDSKNLSLCMDLSVFDPQALTQNSWLLK